MNNVYILVINEASIVTVQVYGSLKKAQDEAKDLVTSFSKEGVRLIKSSDNSWFNTSHKTSIDIIQKSVVE